MLPQDLSKNNIALDIRALQDSSKQRGIGMVIRHLLPELSQTIPNLIGLVDKNGPEVESVPIPLLHLPPHTDLGVFLGQNGVKHIHFLAQYQVPSSFGFSHSVTVHDLFNSYFGTGSKKERQHQNQLIHRLQNAQLYFTVSKYTQSEMIRAGFPASKISVTYPGVNQHCELGRHNPEWAKPFSFPFILTLGNFERRKNLNNMIQAIIRLNQSRQEKIHLVAVQTRDHIMPLLGAKLKIAIARQSDYFHFLGFVSDELLTTLYQNTRLFCFVSKAEGFGLPLLEAMAFDIPILTGNQTALPEVGQNGVLYADPEDIGDITQQMQLAIDQGSISPELRAIRNAIRASFSYRRMANEMTNQFKAAGILA